MNVKEPRTEDEKENAANLLDLVTVRKNTILNNYFFPTNTLYCVASVILKTHHNLLIE